MKTLFWICEKCGAEIIVEPIETTQYRHISCEGCGAEFAVLNSELREKESPAAADRS
jgi:DNA-directed RNA polymerase subunit RPC12/RpoP